MIDPVMRDLAAYELAMQAEQTANDLRVREITDAFNEIGTWSGEDLWEMSADLSHEQYLALCGLVCEVLRDYPPAEARDQVYLASRILRARLAEMMVGEE